MLRLSLAVLALVALTACGDPQPESRPEAPAPTSADTAGRTAPDDLATDDPVTGDPATGDPATGVDPDEAPAPATADAPAARRPAPERSAPEAQPDSEAGATPDDGTLEGRFEGTARETHVPMPGAGVAVLRDVRVGRHAHFDRVVFEFEGDALPGYHLAYIDRPVRECGSGDVAQVAGDGWLEVRFEPARAHTEAGAPTIAQRRRSYRYPTLRALVLTCDFEAVTTWVVGVGSPNRYRVQAFASPARIVLDILH